MNNRRVSNIFVRRLDLDNSFESLHKVRMNVSVNFISASKYTVRLDKGNRHVLITETMDKGTTKDVILKHNNNEINCKSVFEAEKLAVELLK